MTLIRCGAKELSSIVINLGECCNLACKYCFERQCSSTPESVIEISILYDKIVSIIDQIESKLVNIAFYGGEPLLYFNRLKYIVERLSENQTHSFKYGITTNGTLLNHEILTYLNINKFHIHLSIDGPKHVMDLNRVDKNGKSIFHCLNYIITNIPQCYDITARMTITSNNIDYFAHSIDYLIGLGFCDRKRRIKFDFDATQEWSKVDFELIRREFDKCFEILISHYESGGCSVIEPLYKVIKNKQAPSIYCGGGLFSIHIQPDGSFYPCNRLTPSHDNDFYLLKINELCELDKIRGIFIKTMNRKKECFSCQAFNYCKYECPAKFFAYSKKFNEVDEFLCFLTKNIYMIGYKLKRHFYFKSKQNFIQAYGLKSIFDFNSSLFSHNDLI